MHNPLTQNDTGTLGRGEGSERDNFRLCFTASSPSANAC